MKRIKCLFMVCFTLCCFAPVCVSQQKTNKGKKQKEVKVKEDEIKVFYDEIKVKEDEIKVQDGEVKVTELLISKDEDTTPSQPDYIIDAEICAAKGDYKEAIRLATMAADDYRKQNGEDSLDYARALYYLAEYHNAMSNYSEAISIGTKVVEIRQKKLGEKDPLYHYSQSRLVDYECNLEKQQGNEIKVTELVITRDADGYILEAETCAAKGDYKEAIRLATMAADDYRKQDGDDSLDYARALYYLAEYYNALSNYAEAIRFGTKSAEIRRKTLGENDPLYNYSMTRLAVYKDNLDKK